MHPSSPARASYWLSTGEQGEAVGVHRQGAIETDGRLCAPGEVEYMALEQSYTGSARPGGQSAVRHGPGYTLSRPPTEESCHIFRYASGVGVGEFRIALDGALHSRERLVRQQRYSYPADTALKAGSGEGEEPGSRASGSRGGIVSGVAAVAAVAAAVAVAAVAAAEVAVAVAVVEKQPPLPG